MKKFIFVFTLLAAAQMASAQLIYTTDAKVKFFSDAKLEKIEAVNKSATVILNQATGQLESKVLIKGFLFEKALMQEHFNENYLESQKYPSATFKGTIQDFGKLNLSADGTYPVVAKGTMELHGVKKDIEVPGKITVSGGVISVSAMFDVKCADYGIKIEAQKVSNIASTIQVSVDGKLSQKKA